MYPITAKGQRGVVLADASGLRPIGQVGDTCLSSERTLGRAGNMVAERVSRRLAAVLAADIVGYGSLVGRDEIGTLAAVKARRKELLQPLLARHEGRVFKVTGDGVLVEFASAVNAVNCAVALQQGMIAANASLAAGRRIELRIGINLGDVVVEDGDLFGDGVNIAARLQEVAQPNAVCVTAGIYEQVRGKVESRFDELGEYRLKNKGGSVRILQTTPANWPLSNIISSPARDQPSVAVLPLANMSGEPAQDYFSDGMTEEIITELSRFRSLSVIARNSSFAFKDKRWRIVDIARELGVAFVVEGSVRRAGDRLRISVQLVDAGSGNQLWAERYDRDLLDVFALQDEVARSVASKVSGRVEAVGRDRVVRLSASALRAYELVLRARALMSRYNRADNAQALACAEQAARLDPTNARAFAHAAWCTFFNFMACWTDDRAGAQARAYELARRAVELDPTDSFARCILCLIHIMRREYDEARCEIEQAIELNPNDPDVRRYYGDYLAATGSLDAAIEQIELAKRLNPFDTQWVPWIQGLCYFTARRYDAAIASLQQAREPINEVRGWLAASYAAAGRLEEARSTLEEFLRVAKTDMVAFPGRRVEDWEAYWHGALEFRDQATFDHLFEALRKAGLE